MKISKTGRGSPPNLRPITLNNPWSILKKKKPALLDSDQTPDPAETPQALSAVRIRAYQNQLTLSRQADTFLVDTAILGLVAVFLLTGS